MTFWEAFSFRKPRFTDITCSAGPVATCRVNHMAVVAGVMFFAFRALFALMPAFSSPRYVLFWPVPPSPKLSAKIEGRRRSRPIPSCPMRPSWVAKGYVRFPFLSSLQRRGGELTNRACMRWPRRPARSPSLEQPGASTPRSESKRANLASAVCESGIASDWVEGVLR
jgi:hypothetical protein